MRRPYSLSTDHATGVAAKLAVAMRHMGHDLGNVCNQFGDEIRIGTAFIIINIDQLVIAGRIFIIGMCDNTGYAKKQNRKRTCCW